jgi:hypothetical protein
VRVVDALAHLHGDGDVAAGTLLDDGADHRAEQVALPRQGRAAALAGDLRDRAAEVEVDVVGPVLRDEQPHRGPSGGWVGAVELDRPRMLFWVVLDQPHRLGVALDQSARGDHLADVERRVAAPALRGELSA